MNIVKHSKVTPTKKVNYELYYIKVKIFKENGSETTKSDEECYYQVSKQCSKLFPKLQALTKTLTKNFNLKIEVKNSKATPVERLVYCELQFSMKSKCSKCDEECFYEV